MKRGRSGSTHLDTQTAYFAERRPIRMQPVDTPYIDRHFSEVAQACGLQRGATVCEWGSGLGRFSRLLTAHGARVTAIELSPTLAAESRAHLGGEDGFRVVVGDILSTLPELGQTFDVVLGFFVLHHLRGLERYFRAAARALRPGGRVAFAEPNPYNPLFPVQISLTPGMRWRAEAGIYALRPHLIRRAAAAAGFCRVDITPYGALPRQLYNGLARFRRERTLERFVPRALRPFQTIVAER
ncbi:MAG TPA: class I SAM-dependent methyltransferase [Myxococcota bacterium]|nr:class I SAM-dependent methyltransferase [Myxococcota bacterium]